MLLVDAIDLSSVAKGTPIMHPMGKVRRVWSPAFAYVIGLIATDGNLSPDGRHINFTSKDVELVMTYRTILNLQNKIGMKARGGSMEKKYYVVQFGDVLFYRFLLTIGLTPNKSRTIGELKVPRKYFYDFLRGCIDGDGNIHTFRHPESRNPQLRVRLCSASKPFLAWIKNQTERSGLGGFIVAGTRAHVLSFGIKDSVKLFALMYYPGFTYGLRRKFDRAKPHMRA